MPSFDKLLLDPPPRDVVRAILRAQKQVNQRSRHRLKQDRGFWERFVARARRKEGAQSWRAGVAQDTRPRVDVAWWTDALGRRHWRVCGGEAGAHAGNEPPPLGWVYPEALLARRSGESVEWVAVCPECGVGGPPERLGWMGSRCGPCHDRSQEEGARPGWPPLLQTGVVGALRSLRFLEDGGLLATRAWRSVFRWSAGGASRTVSPCWTGEAIPALAPDGTFVRQVEGRAPHFRWSGPGMARRMALPGTRYVRLQFTPDGSRLLVSGFGGHNPDFVGPTYLVTRGPDGPAVRPLPEARPEQGPLALEPDGRGVLGWSFASTLRRWDIETGAFEEWPCPPFPDPGPTAGEWGCHLEVGRTWLVAHRAGATSLLQALHRPTGRWRTLPMPLAGTISALALDPAERAVLAYLAGWLAVWPLPNAGRPVLYQLAQPWAPLTAHSVAFSPEGETLALGMNDGTVRLWPWAALLPAGA